MAQAEKSIDLDFNASCVSDNSARRVVLRNPNYKTPAGPPRPFKALVPSQKEMQQPLVSLMTATPIRGPNRFLRVLAPDPEPFEEEDEYETDSEDITDVIEPEKLSFSRKRTPITALAYSPIKPATGGEKRLKITPQTTPKTCKSINVTIPNTSIQVSVSSPQETPKTAHEKVDQISSAQRLIKARKKLSVSQDSTEETEAQDPIPFPLEQSSVAVNEEENFCVSSEFDSPFFKVPLPPKKIESRKSFVIRKPSFLRPISSLTRSPSENEFPKSPPKKITKVGSKEKPKPNSKSKSKVKPSVSPKPVLDFDDDIPNFDDFLDVNEGIEPIAKNPRKRSLSKTEPKDTKTKAKKSKKKEDDVTEEKKVEEKKVDDSVNDFGTDMDRLYEKARYVTNWVPRMKGKKLVVEGDLLDFE